MLGPGKLRNSEFQQVYIDKKNLSMIALQI